MTGLENLFSHPFLACLGERFRMLRAQRGLTRRVVAQGPRRFRSAICLIWRLAPVTPLYWCFSKWPKRWTARLRSCWGAWLPSQRSGY